MEFNLVYFINNESRKVIIHFRHT